MRARLSSHPDSFQPGIDCLAQFNEYRRNRQEALVAPVEDCLQTSIEHYPDTAYLYGDALSFMLLVRARRSSDATDLQERAIRMAEESFSQSNNRNAKAIFMLARARYFAGDCTKGTMLADRAIRTNPYDAELISYAGSYMYNCGQPQAAAVLKRAIEIDGDNASVALIVLAYIRLSENRPAEALALVERVTPSLRQEPQVDLVRAIALQDLREETEARAIWQSLVADAGGNAKSTAEQIVNHFISTPATAKSVAAMVRERGLQP